MCDGSNGDLDRGLVKEKNLTEREEEELQNEKLAKERLLRWEATADSVDKDVDAHEKKQGRAQLPDLQRRKLAALTLY